MRSKNISDEELFEMVNDIDIRLLNEGVELEGRCRQVVNVAMKEFGYISFVYMLSGAPPLAERIRAAHQALYRKQDLAMGGHIGIYMYRDVFAKISVPGIVGMAKIDPFQYVDLSPAQVHFMFRDSREYRRYFDQFADVFDIEYGTKALKYDCSETEITKRFLGLSKLQIHAAAAILTGGYDGRGAVQSALLACELALKAGAATSGFDEADLKDKFGHKMQKVADHLGCLWPAFDLERVHRVISNQPEYVPNRYSASQPRRSEVGHIVMGAQYIVSEVVRQLSDTDFRGATKPPLTRVYPC